MCSVASSCRAELKYARDIHHNDATIQYFKLLTPLLRIFHGRINTAVTHRHEATYRDITHAKYPSTVKSNEHPTHARTTPRDTGRCWNSVTKLSVMAASITHPHTRKTHTHTHTLARSAGTGKQQTVSHFPAFLLSGT